MRIKNRNDLILLIVSTFIIIVIIFLIIALVVIWSSKKEDTDINSYSYNGYENKMLNLYQNQVKIYLNSSYSNLLIEKLDEDFLEDNNLTKKDTEGIKKLLSDNKLLSNTQAVINDYTFSANEDTGKIVIRFKYYNMYGDEKYVNLIETEPYVYTLAFEIDNRTEEEIGEAIDSDSISDKEDLSYNVSTSAKDTIIGEYEGIEFEIKLVETTQRSLKYNAKITNNSNETVKFDFNNAASTELILKDGSKVKLPSVVAGPEDFYKLPPNSYYNQEFFFNVPLDKQGNIAAMVFHKVTIGDESTTIKINF